MINKEQLAEKLMVGMLNNPSIKINSETIEQMVLYAWECVDLMQAEADKRKVVGVPEALQQTFVNDVEQPRYAPQVFKIDWSLAHGDSKYWAVDENGEANWYQKKPYIDYDEFNYEFDIDGSSHYKAPSFDYKGDWRDSLRGRPL